MQSSVTPSRRSRRTFYMALLGILALSACGPHTPKASPNPSIQAPLSALPGEAVGPKKEAALLNLADLIAELNLSSYHSRGFHGQGLTVAILDNGFDGLDASRGVRLPPDVNVSTAPGNAPEATAHGTKLAELVYALATGSAAYRQDVAGPKLLLLNSNGYTNFVAAIDQAIAAKADIILYSQVWEYGGNLDGHGFIDAQVDRATRAGILWVNASGNYGQSTYQGPVVLGSAIPKSMAHEVTLPFQQRYVRVVVPYANTPVKLVLAWNDFADTITYRTRQDLDLVLETMDGQELSSSRLIQDGQLHDDSTVYSAFAREIIDTTLPAGTYRLRVEANTANFSATSRLRVTASGYGVTLLDRTSEPTVLMPGDDPHVLTIGASDVPYSGIGTIAGVTKPDLWVASQLRYDDGEHFEGTSAAAALAAGALVVYESARGKISHDQAVNLIAQGTIAAPETSCGAPCTASRRHLRLADLPLYQTQP